ncbi:MAG: hypothetical protein ACRDLA_03640 [Thermoleophilaceae bacterium]
MQRQRHSRQRPGAAFDGSGDECLAIDVRDRGGGGYVSPGQRLQLVLMRLAEQQRQAIGQRCRPVGRATGDAQAQALAWQVSELGDQRAAENATFGERLIERVKEENEFPVAFAPSDDHRRFDDEAAEPLRVGDGPEIDVVGALTGGRESARELGRLADPRLPKQDEAAVAVDLVVRLERLLDTERPARFGEEAARIKGDAPRRRAPKARPGTHTSRLAPARAVGRCRTPGTEVSHEIEGACG